MDLAGEKVNDLQVTRYNASVTSVSDASFAEVRRMRQQECVLLDELELLRRDKEAALKERVTCYAVTCSSPVPVLRTLHCVTRRRWRQPVRRNVA